MVLVPSQLAFCRDGLANVNDPLFRWSGLPLEPRFDGLLLLNRADRRVLTLADIGFSFFLGLQLFPHKGLHKSLDSPYVSERNELLITSFESQFSLSQMTF